MSEYIDEDYEVSNTVLNEYLNSFEELKPKIEKENLSSNNPEKEIPRYQVKSEIGSLIDSKKTFKFYFLSYFHDENYLTHLLGHNSAKIDQIMAKSDKTIVFDNYMTYLELINEQRNSKILNLIISFISKNISLLFLYFCTFVIFSFYFEEFSKLFFSFFLFLFGLFALFFLNFKLFELFVKLSLFKFQYYLNSVKNLIYYLKEVELVSLAIKRRYFIEKNSNTTSNIDLDNLNYPFRKHTFKKFKDQFFNLKYLNKYILDLNSKHNFINFDDVDLICAIKDNELSKIMWKQVNDSELDDLTDFYNIDCIKSVIKLNRLLISENFKLILISYLNIILSDFSLMKLIKVLVKFDIRLVKTYFLIREFINEVECLNKLCNLIDLNENAKESDKKIKPISQQLSLEHNLGVHLRNAFLNASELEKINDKKSEFKLEILKLLKYNFEYCDFYYKKLVAEIEGETNVDKKEHKIVSNDQTKTKSDEELNNNKIEEVELVPIEDEIFEADISNIIEQIAIPEIDSDYLFKEKQNEMANKNLFYELKYALKFKKNEWDQREKKAKKIVDGKMVVEEKDKENVDKNEQSKEYGLDTDYLLDNEALKYKLTLRKRKFCKNIDNKDGFNMINYFENKKNKYEYIEDEESKMKPCFDRNIGSNSLLNELFKHKFFNKNEEIFE